MSAHQIETVLTKDGVLVLNDLPFQAGETVEVIIVSRSIKKDVKNPYSLQGTPLIYENPMEPVAVEDWEALK
ncbi:MAG: hypothetical protein AB1757_05600 [Acidobacteriota bacterium]